MSIILNEDDIKFISNHPIIQYNIGENIKEHIDILIEDFKYIKNDYLEFKNSMPKMLFENVAYKNIFDDNLEKLKTELTAHGEIILTTLVNDKAYQHIADTHLNNLDRSLTESYDSFLKNNSKLIDNIKLEFDNFNNKNKNLENKYNKQEEDIKYLNKIVFINSVIIGCAFSVIGLYHAYLKFRL
jgi:hypothetical protein